MRIIVPIVLLFCISCSNSDSTKSEDDATALLFNQLNTRNSIAFNSQDYIDLEKEGDFIPFKFVNDIDIHSNYEDSLYSELTADSVIIYNYFSISGSCGDFVIVPRRSKTGVMFWRKTVVEGEIHNGDVLELGCAMARAFCIRVALPLKDYPFPAIGYNNQVIPLTNQ